MTMPITQRFGANMRRRRTNLGITLQNLADTTGMDRTHLNLVELGKRNASLQTAAKIADALDVTVKELVS